MNKTIKDFTETELKALKSDMYEQIQSAQSNLQVINAELQSRNTKGEEVVDDKKVAKK